MISIIQGNDLNYLCQRRHRQRGRRPPRELRGPAQEEGARASRPDGQQRLACRPARRALSRATRARGARAITRARLRASESESEASEQASERGSERARERESEGARERDSETARERERERERDRKRKQHGQALRSRATATRAFTGGRWQPP